MDRPILFSAPMVRALLAGTKTQTRRVVKPRKDRDMGCELAPSELAGEVNGGEFRNAYCAPGDRLWVRETWRDAGNAWHYAADGMLLPKQRDRDLQAFLAARAPLTWESYTWKPSIHMPRAASRITLEVTGVRVERLQDISEADAQAEGCEPMHLDDLGQTWRTYKRGYQALWEQINGPGSWDANPWVWCVEFRRHG